MNIRRRLALLLPAAAFAFASPLRAADEPGFLGVSIHVDGDGFIPNQRVRSITIVRVVPNSPAARAGLRHDDELIEVDGRRVAGSGIEELRPLPDPRAGQSVALTVGRKDGKVHAYQVVLEPKPPEQVVPGDAGSPRYPPRNDRSSSRSGIGVSRSVPKK